MEEKEDIGGRAYSNGIRLMSGSRSVKAYYNEEGNLKFTVNKVKRNKYAKYIKKIPVLRGILVVLYSISVFLKEVIKNPLKYWFIFVILLLDFFLLYGGNGNTTAVNGIFLIIYILVPIGLILFFRKNISEVLKYHGAEHMAVNYYENDFKGSIEDYSRIHKRCGSNLVFYFLLFQIIGAFFNFGINIILEYLLYLGLAYEAMTYTPEKLLPVVTIIQRFMTREPDEKQLKAAEDALKILTADESLFD